VLKDPSGRTYCDEQEFASDEALIEYFKQGLSEIDARKQQNKTKKSR